MPNVLFFLSFFKNHVYITQQKAALEGRIFIKKRQTKRTSIGDVTQGGGQGAARSVEKTVRGRAPLREGRPRFYCSTRRGHPSLLEPVCTHSRRQLAGTGGVGAAARPVGLVSERQEPPLLPRAAEHCPTARSHVREAPLRLECIVGRLASGESPW